MIEVSVELWSRDKGCSKSRRWDGAEKVWGGEGTDGWIKEDNVTEVKGRTKLDGQGSNAMTKSLTDEICKEYC